MNTKITQEADEEEMQFDPYEVRETLARTLDGLGPRALDEVVNCFKRLHPPVERWLTEAIPAATLSEEMERILTEDPQTSLPAGIWLLSFLGGDAVPALFRLAEHKDAGLREAAVWGLGRIPALLAPEVERLAAFARDEDPEVRRTALRAIDLGPRRYSREVALFVTALEDPDARVREAAASGLADSEPDSTVPVLQSLEQLLEKETDDAVRVAAFQAAWQLSPSEGLARRVLADWPRVSQWEHRIALVELLTDSPMQSESAIAIAKLAAADELAKVRKAAAAGAGAICVRVQERGARQHDASDVLNALLEDPDRAVCRAAAEAIAKLEQKTAHRCLGGLLELLEREDNSTQRAAAQAMAAAGESAAAIASLINLLDDDDVFRSASAARTLGEVFSNDEDAVAELWRTIDDDELEVRLEAALALAAGPAQEGEDGEVVGLPPEVGREEVARVWEIVSEELVDPEAQLRRRAAAALASRGTASWEAFADALAEPAARRTAAQHVGRLTDAAPELRPALLQALDARSAKTRVAVLRALGELGLTPTDPDDEQLQHALTKCLTDENEQVALAAAQTALVLDVRDHRVVETLVAGLASADPEMRLAALHSLEQPALAGVATEELAQLLGDPSAEIRHLAAGLLIHADIEAMPALLGALQTGGAQVRWIALELLGEIGVASTAALDAVTARLADPVSRVRATAALELGVLFRDDSGARDRPSDEARDAAGRSLATACDDPVPQVRRMALRSLLELRADNELILATITQHLHDEDVDMRLGVAHACAVLAGTRIDDVLKLLAQLMADSEGRVRVGACSVAAGLGKEAEPILDSLRPLLASEDSDTSLHAACALAAAGAGAEALPRLLAALDGNTESRILASRGIVDAGEAAAGNEAALLPHARDQNAEVRTHVVSVLGRSDSKDPAIRDALAAALEDENANVRSHAASGLARVAGGDKQVVKSLGALLADPTPEVRISALLGLESMGEAARRAAPQVSHLLGSSNELVRVVAAYTLVRIADPEDEVIDVLTNALSSTEDFAVRMGLGGLVRLGDRAAPAAAAIARVIPREDKELRHGAFIVLERLGKNAIGAAAVLTELLGHAEPEVSFAAATILPGIITKDSRLIGIILSAATDPQDPRREAALAVLASLPKTLEIAAKPLIRGLTDENDSIRAATTIALGKFAGTDPDVLAAMVPLLEDSVHTVRAGAAMILAGQHENTDRIRDIFLESLSSENEDAIAMAASGLAKLGKDAAAAKDQLANAYQATTAIGLRVELAHAIGAIGPEAIEHAPIFLELLAHEHPNARHLGVWGLIELQAPADVAFEPLRRALSDEVDALRADAAYALGKLKPRSIAAGAVEDLIHMLQNDTPTNRLMAATVLGQLGVRARKAIPALTESQFEKDERLSGTSRWALQQIQPK